MRPVLYGVLKNAPALAKVFRVVAFAAIDEERLAYKRLGELDHEMRRTLGGKQGVLLSGHGFVMTGRSIYNVAGSS